jgi:hypothetical protein
MVIPAIKGEPSMEQSHDVRLKDNSSAAVTNDVDQCLNAFDRHLESERGCAPGTREHYLHEARCFLVDAFPDLKTNWEGLFGAREKSPTAARIE